MVIGAMLHRFPVTPDACLCSLRSVTLFLRQVKASQRMSRLSPGLNALVATVLGSHPSLRLLPVSRYMREHVAVYATSNERAIAHMVEAEDRQLLLVAFMGLDYVSVCDVEHDLLPPSQETVSLLLPELRKGLLARFYPVSAGDVCRIVEAVCSAR